MLSFINKKSLSKHLSKIRRNKIIGYVPTMGALHDGHLSLIENSKKKCDITICSIFINPTQFNDKNDFLNYPKNHSKDLACLKRNKCDITYIPNVDDLYMKNETSKNYNFNGLEKFMEGKYRPGHFYGMATVVEKLFNIIKPDYAFFGQKDLQQLQIVKALTKKMKINTVIKKVKTIREANGLAKSSRNSLLTANQKKEASLIYSCLVYCKENMQKPITELKDIIHQKINHSKYLNLEYIEFVDLKTMQPIKIFGKANHNAICIAVKVNKVRLIDNIIL